MIFSFSNNSPIFPNDQVKMCAFHVAAKSATMEYLDEFPVQLRLFFSGGIYEKELHLSKILKYNNISLLESEIFR
jgi:hypothetical protein